MQRSEKVGSCKIELSSIYNSSRWHLFAKGGGAVHGGATNQPTNPGLGGKRIVGMQHLIFSHPSVMQFYTFVSVIGLYIQLCFSFIHSAVFYSFIHSAVLQFYTFGCVTDLYIWLCYSFIHSAVLQFYIHFAVLHICTISCDTVSQIQL